MKSYRKGVGIFLLNANHQLWGGKRIDFKSNYWQMPQGGIDKDELPVDAMKRELMEEVGVLDVNKLKKLDAEYVKTAKEAATNMAALDKFDKAKNAYLK